MLLPTSAARAVRGPGVDAAGCQSLYFFSPTPAHPGAAHPRAMTLSTGLAARVSRRLLAHSRRAVEGDAYSPNVANGPLGHATDPCAIRLRVILPTRAHQPALMMMMMTARLNAS